MFPSWKQVLAGVGWLNVLMFVWALNLGWVPSDLGSLLTLVVFTFLAISWVIAAEKEDRQFREMHDFEKEEE